MMKKVLTITSLTLITLALTGCAGTAYQSHYNDSEASATADSTKIVDSEKMETLKNVSQINRYAIVKNGPTDAEINPLLAVSTFRFPQTVYTVGEAVSQVLRTTGYRLSPNLSVSVKQTLKHTLPITNRKLGPMKIQSVLSVLMGADVYTLQRDPLHRLINFKVKKSMATVLGEKK